MMTPNPQSSLLVCYGLEGRLFAGAFGGLLAMYYVVVVVVALIVMGCSLFCFVVV